jgi:cyclopropane fatty-acyl-phospholipid synthase-like methyltransferase
MKNFINFVYILFRRWLISENELSNFINLSNKKILDLGCGYGYLSYLIAKKFPTSYIVGIDVNNSRIERAKQRFKLPNLQFFVGDVCNLDVKDKFDIIIAIDLFHHIPLENHDKILYKVRENLASGGIFILRDINKNSSLKIFNTLHDGLINKFFYPNYKSFSEWRKFLDKFAFRINKIVYFNKIIYPYLYIISSRRTIISMNSGE